MYTFYGVPTVDIGAYEASSSFLVTSADDSLDAGTLRTAVGWANINVNANPANLSNPAPNTIYFIAPNYSYPPNMAGLPAPLTITLSSSLGPLVFSDTAAAEAIVGPGSDMLTISGSGSTQVFSVSSEVTATLSDLTISGGSAMSGGGIDNAGSLTLTNIVISDSTATNYGGGVQNSGMLTMSACTIEGNSVLVSGGGGIENDGTMTIDTSTISGNSVQNRVPSPAVFGGGIENQGMMTIAYSTVESNTASGGYGGGIENQSGTLAINDSTIAMNKAGIGGGIDNAFGNLSLTDSTIGGNLGSDGGGISNGQNGTVRAVSSTIAENYAFNESNGGGGLYATGGTTVALRYDRGDEYHEWPGCQRHRARRWEPFRRQCIQPDRHRRRGRVDQRDQRQSGRRCRPGNRQSGGQWRTSTNDRRPSRQPGNR